MKNIIMALLAMMALFGCGGTYAIPEAINIELVNNPPDRAKCKYLGEVVGSEGTWLTGDMKSDQALMSGSRNQLRNEAYYLGGNLVQVMGSNTSDSWGSAGSYNTTTVGKVFYCSD